MPNWDLLFGDLLAAQVAAWIVAFALVIVLITKVWPWVRRLVRLVDALQELPEYMERTTKKIDQIHHEVNYNNGSSVKDAIARLDGNVLELVIRMDERDREEKTDG